MEPVPATTPFPLPACKSRIEQLASYPAARAVGNKPYGSKEVKMSIFKKVERRSCGCCLFIVLGFLLLVAGLIFLIVRAASAESGMPAAYDVVLVSDQSTSMWDCDGIGTDPELLRVDATRLFINTLGADSSARYRLALLHFGGEVTQVAPLTDLADAAARQALIEAASHPQPMRWTDHLLALRAAGTVAARSRSAGQPAPDRPADGRRTGPEPGHVPQRL